MVVPGPRIVFRYREGSLEALLRDGAPGLDLTRFEPEGEDSYRVVLGPERGELLVVVREDKGEVVHLELATYPFARRPEPLAGSR